MSALSALATPLIGRPWAILLIAVLLGSLDRIDRRPLRGGGAVSPRAKPPLRFTAILWTCLAVWELMVQLLTPEADIRVDWLLVWPLLVLITVLSLTTAALSAIRHR